MRLLSVFALSLLLFSCGNAPERNAKNAQATVPDEALPEVDVPGDVDKPDPDEEIPGDVDNPDPVDDNPPVDPPVNAPPVVISVFLGSGPYFETSAITADVQSYDEEGEPVRLEYEWFVNGITVAAHDAPTLSGEFFNKTDSVFVRVTPYPDGITGAVEPGLAVDSNAITISNTPPNTPSVAVYPTLATSGTNLWVEVVADSIDDDGDSVFYTYDWYKNGELQNYSEFATSVPGTDVAGGDAWTVFVVPNDNMESGWASMAAGPPVIFDVGEQVAGSYHTCVRSTLKNAVRCWGKNASGQLGDGTTTNRIFPVTIPIPIGTLAADSVTKLALGTDHTCALYKVSGTGTVACWGSNAFGQLGVGDRVDRYLPTVISTGLTNVADITAGEYHTCARETTGGAVKCWGKNDMGQIGTGTMTNANVRNYGIILAARGGRCATAGATTVTLSACTGASTQDWLMDDAGALRSRSDYTKCMTVQTVSPWRVDFAACTGALTQLWTWYDEQLISVNDPTKCMRIAGNSNTNGAQIEIVTCDSTYTNDTSRAQRFQMLYAGTLMTTNGLCLQPASLVSSANIQTAVCNGTAAQNWYMDGQGLFHNQAGSNWCMNLSGGAPTVNQQVILYDCWDQPANSRFVWSGSTVRANQNNNYCFTETVGLLKSTLCNSSVLQNFTWTDARATQKITAAFTCAAAPDPDCYSVIPSATAVSGALSIAAGGKTTCARDASELKCWGSNTDDQIGADASKPVQSAPFSIAIPGGASSSAGNIAVGQRNICAISSGGTTKTLYCSGYGFGSAPLAVGDNNLSVTAGLSHVCVLTTANGVKCAGGNEYAQLGNGKTSSTPLTQLAEVPNFTGGVLAVSAGAIHTCVMKGTAGDKSGAMSCWGDNTYGQLGNGSSGILETYPVDTTGGWAVAVDAGGSSSCVVTISATVLCWGNNTSGQIGDNTQVQRNTATAVSGLSKIMSVAIGREHACALSNQGTLSCWGRGTEGQLGNAANTAAQKTPVTVSGVYSKIALGDDHTCAITDLGEVKCWGANTLGQLGDGTATPRNAPGTAVALGQRAIAIAAGIGHSCALLSDGTGRCWGDNAAGQLGNNSTVSSSSPVAVLGTGMRMISTHGNFTCFVNAAGQLYCWGKNSDGQLGLGNTAVTIIPTLVNIGYAVAAMETGRDDSCALTVDGRIFCWGKNADGEVGDGTFSPRKIPQAVPEFANGGATSISVGAMHACAIMNGGGVKCWGDNQKGTIGNGSYITITPAIFDHLTPSLPAGQGSDVVSVDVGALHSCDVQLGQVNCWGDNPSGQLGDNSVIAKTSPVPVVGISNAGQVSGGRLQSCSLSMTGGMKCWGSDATMQLGNGATTDGLQSNTPVDVSGLSGTGILKVGTFCMQPLGTGIVLLTCDGSLAQDWVYDNDGLLRNRSDLTQCLNSTTNNFALELSPCNAASTGQQWYSDPKWHPMRDQGQCLDSFGGTPANGVAIYSYTCNTGGGQNIFYSYGISAFMDTGDGHTCAVMDVTGELRCWGGNGSGQLGQNNLTSYNTPQSVLYFKGAWEILGVISGGNAFSCGVVAAGPNTNAVRCWGQNGSGQFGVNDNAGRTTPTISRAGRDNLPVIGTGQAHTCVAKSTGGLVCYGYGAWGQLGDRPPINSDTADPEDKWTPVTVRDPANSAVNWTAMIDQVTGGWDSTCAITGGNLFCWGYNEEYTLGVIKDAGCRGCRYGRNCDWQCTSTSWSGACTARNETKYCETYPAPVLSGGVTHVAMNDRHTCAVQNGGAKCWGRNTNGQIGNGTASATPTAVPTAPTGLGASTGVRLVSVGTQHSCAVVTGASDTVKCWGLGTSGQIGDATNTSKTTPTNVSTLTAIAANSVKMITSGRDFTCVLLNNPGSVKCWGYNVNGEVGNGTFTNPLNTPQFVRDIVGTGNLDDVISIRSGSNHTCASRTTGQSVCWGAGGDGRLGNGLTGNSNVPVEITGYSGKLASVARVMGTGAGHTCFIAITGEVYCQGLNDKGQLGNNSLTASSVKVKTSGILNATSIALGAKHTCVVEGTIVKCWGDNFAGQLGLNNTTTQQIPVAISSTDINSATQVYAGTNHTCALLADATAKCWGSNSDGQIGDGTVGTNRLIPTVVKDGANPLTGILSLSGGDFHTCANLTGGVVKCWGANAVGQIGVYVGGGVSTPQDSLFAAPGMLFQSISMGKLHGCGVAGGAAYCWGDNSFDQVGDGLGDVAFRGVPTPVLGLSSGVSTVKAGGNFSCALMIGGTVKCWGDNSYGQTGTNEIGSTVVAPADIPLGGANATLLSVGEWHACAALSDNTVRCWGNNYFGQVGNGESLNHVAISAPVTGLGAVISISAGVNHTCAVTSTNAVKCWGYNGTGQLGTGDRTQAVTPIAVSGLGAGTNTVAIVAGESHSCALKSTGEVKCWGNDSYGQIGTGDETATSGTGYWDDPDVLTPVQSDGLVNTVAKISAYGNQTCIVTTTDQAQCWGSNAYGQLGGGVGPDQPSPTVVPGLLAGAKDVFVGMQASCTKDINSAIRCWGDRSVGEIPMWGPRPVLVNY